MRKSGLIVAAWLATVGVAASAPTAPLVKRVDQVVLDPAQFDAAFGGISGIDYDRRAHHWVLLSDDRSDHAPARFYSASVERRQGRWMIRGHRGTPLRDRDGAAFPTAGSGQEAVDPEAVRVAPDGNTLIWSSEGDVRDGYGPAVRRMDRRGRAIETLILPANLRFDPTGKHGIRDNGTLEGMAFTADNALWLAMESPLIEDGVPAGSGRSALLRFTRLQRGQPARQFAYRLDAMPPATDGAEAAFGVTEILALNDHRILVIERSSVRASDGRFRFHCRLYLADFGEAGDVAAIAA